MPFQMLKLEYANQAATLTLNRPEKRNAVSPQMIGELVAAFDEVERNASARVLILTGAGKAFCSGMDLEQGKAIASLSPAEHLEDARRMARMVRRLWSFPKPTVAAVNGHAIAGGTGIATACDFSIAVAEAKFGYPEVKIGYLPGVVSVFLSRQVGEKQARELLLTGRIFDAVEALRLGLLTKVVPAQELTSAVNAVVADLLASSPESLRTTKKLLCEFAAPEVDRNLEIAVGESARMRSVPDYKEGLAAFLEKRAPRWSS